MVLYFVKNLIFVERTSFKLTRVYAQEDAIHITTYLSLSTYSGSLYMTGIETLYVCRIGESH